VSQVSSSKDRDFTQPIIVNCSYCELVADPANDRTYPKTGLVHHCTECFEEHWLKLERLLEELRVQRDARNNPESY
jgi:hypothetical protein